MLLTLSHYIREHPTRYCHLTASCFISQAAFVVSVCPLCIMTLNTWNKTLALKTKYLTYQTIKETKGMRDLNEAWQATAKKTFWLRTSVIGNYISK